jgi:hypothetical protein
LEPCLGMQTSTPSDAEVSPYGVLASNQSKR